ncbi:SAM-dependent methyltransferase [Acinetobacter populi]|uniref:SAM-dependent methyltransferase n=2 Tax=Acinetobacter populi TaxID=1582270 RepID=A0A1Z9YX65_9GAMM|nr:SAM-dependent methyltransferase [Acinetobacter populi]
MTDETLVKEIAAQLRNPQGQKGIEMAEMMNQTNIAMTLHSIACLDIEPHQSILELGHGNCGHLAHLLAQQEGLHYTGLEISALMQQEAIRLNQSFMTQKQAEFLLYDGLNLNFAEQQFDRIFSVNTLYFWQQPVALLNELYRVLKPHGLLNLTFAQKDFMQQLPFTQYNFELYDLEKLEHLVSQTTFQIKTYSIQQDVVKSKMGDLVEREFMTATLYK